MDYGVLPPEINSARMYIGPGSAPMLAAASAWDMLAAELQSTASCYETVISGLAGEAWLGPASASMAAAVTPYMVWMTITGAQAEQTAAQAAAAAGAYEAAFAMTVPPAAVAANRAQLIALVATNFLGLNTPAIAATEAHYGEMWAQDAAAMYGYAASSAVASTVKPFTQPPETTNPAGQAGHAAAVSQATATSVASGAQTALNQLISALPTALQSLASPTGPVNNIWNFLNSSFMNGIISAGYVSPPIIQQSATAAMADINAVAVGAAPESTALPPMGSGSGNAGWTPLLSASVPFGSTGVPFGSAGGPAMELGGVSAGTNRAALVGRLSVPQSWVAATQVENHAGAALPGGGWTSTASSDSSAGVPGVPGVPGANTGRHFGSGPRYGFHVTVMPRPPAAG